METGFLLSFLAGIAAILSPCVLPLIPVIAGFSILKRTNSEIVSFALGFLLVFSIITILTAIFTAAINYYLFYFRIAASLVLIGLGIFFILNKKFPGFSQTPNTRHGILGSFSFGFLTCLAWSPCFGPYVAAVATYSASTGDMWYSIINMVLFAGGFALTIFIIAILMSRIDLKPLIKYSDWIRIISGAVISIAGFYMLLGLLGFI